MNIDIQTEGFVEASRLYKRGVRPALVQAVFKTANYLETQAKKNIKESVYSTTPPKEPFKRTGKAQQSITIAKLGDLQSRVFMGVAYGKYLEYGTGIHGVGEGAKKKKFWTTFGGILESAVLYEGMKPRPFWKPAIEATKKEAPNILKKEVEKLLSE